MEFHYSFKIGEEPVKIKKTQNGLFLIFSWVVTNSIFFVFSDWNQSETKKIIKSIWFCEVIDWWKIIKDTYPLQVKWKPLHLSMHFFLWLIEPMIASQIYCSLYQRCNHIHLHPVFCCLNNCHECVICFCPFICHCLKTDIPFPDFCPCC